MKKSIAKSLIHGSRIKTRLCTNSLCLSLCPNFIYDCKNALLLTKAMIAVLKVYFLQLVLMTAFGGQTIKIQ